MLTAAIVGLIFVALLIPITAIVVDSPVVRAWAAHRHGIEGDGPGDVRDLEKKVTVLENELEAMSRQVELLQEGQQYLQRLLEDPAHRPGAAQRQLPKSSD